MTDVELPDVNVLVALMHPDHVHHRAAQSWFGSVDRFATTPITESGFLRLALNPNAVGGAISAASAISSLRLLRAHARAEFLPDACSLADPAIDLVGLAGFRQVTDLHLVNLAAAHSARLVTLRRQDRSNARTDRPTPRPHAGLTGAWAREPRRSRPRNCC